MDPIGKIDLNKSIELPQEFGISAEENPIPLQLSLPPSKGSEVKDSPLIPQYALLTQALHFNEIPSQTLQTHNLAIALYLELARHLI